MDRPTGAAMGGTDSSLFGTLVSSECQERFWFTHARNCFFTLLENKWVIDPQYLCINCANFISAPAAATAVADAVSHPRGP